ncbi:MAG: hypothetical protein NVSMB25_05130 [Thermoleophilaceae bacterium]
MGTILLSGCSGGREGGAGREGRAEDVGHLAYNVFLTRQLNLKDVEDASYYQGPEAPPGYTLEGVFISVCNEARGGPAYQSASSFKIVDTQGVTYYPIQLPASSLFAYRPGLVKHRECIPRAGSTASTSPTSGALLLFQLPLTGEENRPMDLVIHGPTNPSTGKSESAKIELDI